MILAIDPGHAKKIPGIGWATFDLDGKALDYGQILPEDFPKFLRDMSPTVIVYERYRVRPWKKNAHHWSEMPESQQIGMILMYKEFNPHVEIVAQDPGNKEIGLMWAGTKPPANHAISHQVEAFGHGVYYIVQNKIRTAASFQEHKKAR